MEYFKDNHGILYCGDVLEELRKISDNTVNMCVTSPPYWGLRDYQTAEWEGGDEQCDHIEQYKDRTKCAHSGGIGNKRPDFDKNQTAKLSGLFYYKDICKKCGAKRIDKQMGLESTPEEYVGRMVKVFREVYRVLKKDGTLWLNLGDSYYGSGCGPSGNFGCPNNQRINQSKGRKYLKIKKYKPRDLIGLPWMLGFALRDDGWYLRQDIIWAKKNPMPESVKNRCTKSHEYVFLMSKSKKYYYDYNNIKEVAKYSGYNSVSGKTGKYRNKRSVWCIATKPFKGAHFSVFPPDLIEPCILAGCPEGGVVLDPFMGSGTTAMVCENLNRKWLGIELKPEYCSMIRTRIEENKDLFTEFNISKGDRK